jgi:threonine/homoserine/homoserine lactone efflux protein
MPEWELFRIFLIAALALLLVPGPAVMYIVARSIAQGRKAGLVSVLGIAVGSSVHIGAASLGLSALLMSSILAFMIVKYLGAAYLIYLGIRTLRTKVTPEENKPVEDQPLWRIFRQGMIVNALNPKTALFFLAFLPQFVNPQMGTIAPQVLFLGLVFTVLGVCTDSMYALLAGTVGNWLRGNIRYLKAQHLFAGVVYILLGFTAAFASSDNSSS